MSPEEISKTTLEDIIDSFQEAAILVDKDGRIIFANNTFAERVRKDSNEIIDSSIYDLFPPHVAEKKKILYRAGD